MPPRRRKDGPPPGGHTQLPDSKHPTPAKRPRDQSEDTDEPASKRHQVISTPQPYKKPFGFDSTRNASFIRSAPGNLHKTSRDRTGRNINRSPSRNVFGSQRRPHPIRPSSLAQDSPFDNHSLRPTKTPESEDRINKPEQEKSAEAENISQPQTPSRSSASKGLMGMLSSSASAMFSYLTGTPARQGTLPGQGPNHEQDEDPAHDSEQLSTIEHGSPHHEPEDSPSARSTTRRSLNHMSGTSYDGHNDTDHPQAPHSGQEAMENDDLDQRFDNDQPEHSVSRKRKLTSINDETPGQRNRGFGIDDDYPDLDDDAQNSSEEVENEASDPSTPPAKRQKSLFQTPLKSSMKRPNASFTGPTGRSAKSVKIDLTRSSSKLIYGQYGRAGDYRGSTFSDVNSFSSPSSLFSGGAQSPTGTNKDNAHSSFHLNKSIIDPNDRTWRPSLANPKPGHFRVPDLDEEDEDDLSFNDDPAIIQPSTPRMSHAELPGTGTSTVSDSTPSDPTESKLNKARSEAQKYKPKDSSRLSLVEQARSRSSSPPSSVSAQADDGQDVTTPEDSSKGNNNLPSGISSKIVAAPKQLDNTIVGDDGMTDYEREHQYDEWAHNLDWPEPQTYEDSGVGSAYITNLIRDRWSEEDSLRSHEFWEKEFDEVDAAMNAAKAQGLVLELITGVE